MKKILYRLALCLCLTAVLAGAWFWGYHHRKNLDNIPSRELMVGYCLTQGEDFASKKIEGYSLDALKEIWGEPDGNLFGLYGYIWDFEDHFITVYFDQEGLAQQAKLGERQE